MDKDEIIELAKISGCDLDGDVVLIAIKHITFIYLKILWRRCE